MASVDQPLKKRKLYDPFPDQPPIAPPPQTLVSPPPPPPPPQSPPLSQDEILRRRRNREEIRNLYDCYRRIRFCVAQKDARLVPDFEQAYLSLITASRGCTSVQRIVAELIPRYASFCPTALEAAAKVSINMYNWSFAIIMRGEDVDTVAYQTAKACVFGLVDICCTASREAPSSSVISGICSAVFQNVLTFFTSTFEGQNISQIGCREIQKLQGPTEIFYCLKQEPADCNESPLQKLFKFRALSLLHIFFSSPKDLLDACFELLVTRGTDTIHHKGAEYFLNQLTSQFNDDEVTNSSNRISDGIPLCTDSVQCDRESKGSEDVNPVSIDNINLKKPLLISTNCFIGMALHMEPSLRNWMLWRYKKLRDSVSSEGILAISAFLEKIFASLSDAVEEAFSEDSDMDHSDPSKCISMPYADYKIPIQHIDCADTSNREHSLGVHDPAVSDALCKSDSAPENDAGHDLKPQKTLLSNKVVPQSRTGGLTCDGERSASMTNLEIRNLEGSCANKCSPKDMKMNQFVPSVPRKQSAFRTDDLDRRTRATEVEKNHTSNTDLGLPVKMSAAGSTSNTYPSPGHNLNVHRHASFNHNCWYYDGDPAAMDVFLASKLLWLGSLGHSASEMLVRLQFEDFGPLVQFIFVRAKDFALIEYRNIMDAVRAREYMQGSSPWGGCLRIKFVDRGLGSRGIANVAVGDSCNVYVGKVPTQWAREEILRELMMAGMRKPHVTDLTSESALLLEFGSAEEAAGAIEHIRRLRKETEHHTHSDKCLTMNTCSNDKFVSGYQLLVRHIDVSISDEELINAFSRYGELTRWQFNRAACCCLIEFRTHEAAERAKSHLHGVRFGGSSILVEFRADNSGTGANHMVFSPPAPSVHDSSAGGATARNVNGLGCFPSHGDLYPTGMEIRPPNSYSSSFLYTPEGDIRELTPSRLKLETLPTQVHNGHPYQSNWISSAEMLESGSRKINDCGRSTKLDPSFSGSMAPQSAEQVWQYNKQEAEPQMSASYPPASAHSGSLIPPPIPAPSFVRPVYFNPGNSWDNPAHNPTPSFQIRTGTIHTDNRQFNACSAIPFVPSSMTMVSQLHGGSMQRVDQMGTVPSLPSLVPPPPPDAPPPLPPSPPPLPFSQPPSVPPPPGSPPQSGPGPSSLQFGEPHMKYQWQGTLSKSGVHYCTIYATREDSPACRYSNSISEPADWPSSLDVTKRTDIRNVKSTFASTRSHRREVCRLLPSTASDQKGFHDFVSYLKQRECAGVIKVPAGQSLWARLLFILPHSPDTCSLLGISPHPTDCLIGLVLPKDTSTEGA